MRINVFVQSVEPHLAAQSEAVFGIVNVDSEYICLAMEEKRSKRGYGRLKYCAVSFSLTTIIDTLSRIRKT